MLGNIIDVFRLHDPWLPPAADHILALYLPDIVCNSSYAISLAASYTLRTPDMPFCSDPDMRLMLVHVFHWRDSQLFAFIPYPFLHGLIQGAPTKARYLDQKQMYAWEQWSSHIFSFTTVLAKPVSYRTSSLGSRIPLYMSSNDDETPEVCILDLNPWAVRQARISGEHSSTIVSKFRQQFNVNPSRMSYTIYSAPSIRSVPVQSPPNLAMDSRGFTALVSDCASPTVDEFLKTACC